jgi:hypothetical protein
MPGTSLVPIPVDYNAIFSDCDNHSVFSIVLFYRKNISLKNVVFETLLRFSATEIFPILLPLPELVSPTYPATDQVIGLHLSSKLCNTITEDICCKSS